MLAVAAMYNFMFLSDLEDEIKAAQGQQTALVAEKASYEKRRAEYLAYRNELTKLQEEQREVLKILPRKSEISTFLSSIQEQAEVSGVEIENLTPDAEVPEDLYVRIPVKIEVVGTYHSITKFFKNISDLQRIVNLENVVLLLQNSAAVDSESAPARARLKGKFVAVTYKFAEAPGAAGSGP
jgi:type IV pilus assembly protein PilO